MFQLFKENREIVAALFVLSMAISILSLLSFEGEQSLVYEDSKDYIQIAKNLVERGIYSMDVGPELFPDNFRTPISPFFIAPFFYFNLSLYHIAIVQDLVKTLAVIVIFILSLYLFDKKTAVVASVFFALEPYTALVSNQILTEPFFILTFTPAVLLLAIYSNKRESRYLYWGAALLGMAALTRPVAFPLSFLVVVAIVMGGKFFENWKKIFIVATIFVVVVSPWIIRNKLVLGTFSPSSLISYNLYNYNAKHFDRWLAETGRIRDGEESGYPLVDLENYHRADKASEFSEAGKNFILKRPAEYILFIIYNSHKVFSNSGYANIIYGLDNSISYEKMEEFSTSLINWDFQNAAQIAQEKPLIVILPLGALFFILAALLAVINPFLKTKTESLNRAKLFMVLSLIFYAALISPFGAARYRVPVNPIIFLLAIDSILILYGLFSKNFRQEHGLLLEKITNL